MNKKVKRSVEKIAMPDDVKERIIANCETAAKSSTSDNGHYSDQVYKIEHVKSHNFRRAVSGIAACAVLAGGIGLSAHLMKKQPSPSSISASPEAATDTEEVISEPLTQPLSASQQDPLMEEFLMSDTFYLTIPTYVNGEPNGSRSAPLNQVYSDSAKELVKKYTFTEISEDEWAASNDWDYISLETRSFGNSFYYTPSSLTIHRDGFACLSFTSYNSEKLKNDEYEVERSDRKYYRCEKADELMEELLKIDTQMNGIAPFGDFSGIEFIIPDYDSSSDLVEGDYPTEIDMKDELGDVAGAYSVTIPTVNVGRKLTQDERDQLADFFNHQAEYTPLDEFVDLPENNEHEVIKFSYLSDNIFIRIFLNNNGLLEFDHIPFTWDKTSGTAVVGNGDYSYFEEYYIVDYAQFREKIVEVLGEDVIFKFDTSYDTPPFGHLTDYDLNSYQSFGVDWAQGVPEEAVASVKDYIEAHHWTEVSQPIENAVNNEKSANSFVVLYNSLYDGGVECSFAFFKTGYVSMLKSDGTETWYKCSEGDDIAAGVDNIIQNYFDNN